MSPVKKGYSVSKGSASSRTQAGAVDLAGLFGAAAQALAANQSALNRADAQNQNHGDNMVQAFEMIAKIMADKPGTPAQQLSQAGQYLSQHANSGSAQVYAQGLARAAQQFEGQKAVTPGNAMTLLQSLLGGDQPAAAGGDLLGSFLGAGGAESGQGEGIDLADVVNAGLTFMNAKNQGQDNLQAAVTALVSSGPLGTSPHRQQSGQLVAGALLQALAAVSRKK